MHMIAKEPHEIYFRTFSGVELISISKKNRESGRAAESVQSKVTEALDGQSAGGALLYEMTLDGDLLVNSSHEYFQVIELGVSRDSSTYPEEEEGIGLVVVLVFDNFPEMQVLDHIITPEAFSALFPMSLGNVENIRPTLSSTEFS